MNYGWYLNLFEIGYLSTQGFENIIYAGGWVQNPLVFQRRADFQFFDMR